MVSRWEDVGRDYGTVGDRLSEKDRGGGKAQGIEGGGEAPMDSE